MFFTGRGIGGCSSSRRKNVSFKFGHNDRRRTSTPDDMNHEFRISNKLIRWMKPSPTVHRRTCMRYFNYALCRLTAMYSRSNRGGQEVDIMQPSTSINHTYNRSATWSVMEVACSYCTHGQKQRVIVGPTWRKRVSGPCQLANPTFRNTISGYSNKNLARLW